MATATIALGIGASVAIFSVVHAVLLRPLPYQDPERVVHIMNRSNTASRLLVAFRDVVDYQEQATLFEHIGARTAVPFDATLTGGEEPVHVRAVQVTNNLFSVLGFEPALGRGFLSEDATIPGAESENDSVPPTPPGLMLSHGLWLRASGGDPDIIGRNIEINGMSGRVIGVMPRDFAILPYSERAGEAPADLWLPFFIDFRDMERRGRSLVVYGRLKPGVTVEQAQAQMDAISVRLQEEEVTYRNENIQVQVLPVHHDVVKGVQPALLVLTGAVAFLLLLSCANVANLLLVRGRGRLNELSTRAALGCGRRRLASQALSESLVLALGGGLAGLALSWLAIQVLLSLKPANVPRLEGVALSLPVVAFSIAASLLAAVLVGLLPAIGASRINVIEGLKDQARGSMGTKGSRLLGSLVVVEVAVSMALLVGSGLMVRSFRELQRVRPGFEPQGVLTLTVNVYGERYQQPGAWQAFIETLTGRLRGLPGVEQVGGVSQVPLSGKIWNGPYAWDEDSEARWPAARAAYRVISGNYFQAMGTRLLAGRAFSEGDTWEYQEHTSPVIVDEKLAREAWPNEDPIGKTFIAMRSRERVEVVGVVEHIRHRSLQRETYGTIYFPQPGIPNVVIRASGDLAALTSAVRREVNALDPTLSIYNVATLKGLVDDQLAPTHFTLFLMSVFAAVALVLATVGLYGVISYAVRQRTAEIGIRMTFGADKDRILRLVVGRGVLLTVLGVVAGVAAVLALSRFMSSLLYEVSANDPMTLVIVAVLLSIVGLVASYVPARRATRIDPVAALRTE
jgi:putative ABC transport system permease protein